MNSEGQRWALSQLQEIADASNRQLELLAVSEPVEAGKALEVEVSIDCSGYPKQLNGIPFRARERIVLRIPAEFPLDRPDALFAHTRYANFPHVQWGKQICLYQSSDSEWQPDDGMYGFVQRLDEWLRHTARGEFDPLGFPLHPPVAYRGATFAPMVIPGVNAPAVTAPWWVGYAEITAETDVRAELGQWHYYKDDIPDTRLAVAILLPTDMPAEYPTKIRDLERILAPRHVSADVIKLLLEMAALRNDEGKPLYFILGAAMRGTSGTNERLQHLACWFISAEQSKLLYTAALRAKEEQGQIAAAEFAQWAETANINWCTVREERPEIVVPRDQGSALSWWRGRPVTLLGCGAIGSVVAMLLARAGIAKIRLYDNGVVTPGILVRQNYERRQIGYTKVSATKVRLQRIHPGLEVEDLCTNVVTALRTNADEIFDADVVINATASTRVAAVLEKHFRDHEGTRPPIASLVLGHRADMALMTYSVPGAHGVTTDIDRRAKIALAGAVTGRVMLDEFWPSRGRATNLFQPEPGCSDPTFVGSAADVYGLSASMVNVLSRWLRESKTDERRAYTLAAPGAMPKSKFSPEHEFTWPADFVLLDDRQGYQIRMTTTSRNVLLGWIRAARRRMGPTVETGGLLFGQIDDFLKVVWIDEVSGPPPDSLASPAGLVCGVAGTAELNAEKSERTRGSVRFIGMWHTHPYGRPRPSCTDLRAMSKLWKLPDFTARHFLMLIVGGSEGWYHMAGHLFARRRRGKR
jgi:integrative and conjugative element protein (TIGR02256 family)